jgi:hypothetical protein
VFGDVEEIGENCHQFAVTAYDGCGARTSLKREAARLWVAILPLGGGREYCGADDLAVYLFVLRGLDLGFVVVDLIVDGTTYDEVCGVHGVVRIGAAGVGLSLGIESEVMALMLMLLVDGAVGLGVFQGGVSLNFVGERWKGREDRDG